MAQLPDVTRRALAILEDMRTTRELTPRAVSKLRAAMLAGEDAYPYYSADRRPYVWSNGERFTAQAFNARIQREALEGLRGASSKGSKPAPDPLPLVLWRMPTPGFYYTDEHGRAWATFTGGAGASCARCGAIIYGGYLSPAMVNDPPAHLCAAHVATYGSGGNAGEPFEPDGE